MKILAIEKQRLGATPVEMRARLHGILQIIRIGRYQQRILIIIDEKQDLPHHS